MPIQRHGINGERHLIHRLFTTTVTLMVFRFPRIVLRLTMACLLLLCLAAESAAVAVRMTVDDQDTFEGHQHDALTQNAMMTFAHNDDRDTLRRGSSTSALITMYASHGALSHAEPFTVDPSGQTAHSPPSCPLHQEISIYRL